MYRKRSRRVPVPLNRSYLACIASVMSSTLSMLVDPIGAVPISWAKESFRLFGFAGASEASRTSPSSLRRPLMECWRDGEWQFLKISASEEEQIEVGKHECGLSFRLASIEQMAAVILGMRATVNARTEPDIPKRLGRDGF